MTDTFQEERVPLSTCLTGDVSINNDSTERVADLFSGLPHQWGWAQMYRGVDNEGNQTEDVYVHLGLSDNEYTDDVYSADFMSMFFGIRVDGTSGTIDDNFSAAGVGSILQRTGGEYIGNGSGIWFLEDISGSWELDNWQAGSELSGTVTLTYVAGCATSLSRLTYTANFDLPLSGLDGETYRKCEDFEGDTLEPPYGRVEVTSGTQALSGSDTGSIGAYYSTDNDKLIVGASADDAQLLFEVESPSIGANQGTTAFYQEGDCTWRASQASDVDVTIADNGNGTLLEGPMNGTFELDLPFFSEGSSGSCDESNRVIEGTFGMAVCSEPNL